MGDAAVLKRELETVVRVSTGSTNIHVAYIEKQLFLRSVNPYDGMEHAQSFRDFTMIVLAVLAAIPVSLVALRFCVYFQALCSRKVTELPIIDAERYRPMLQLPENRQVPVRRALCRQYLRELTADYGKLLAGVRLILVSSDVERPDLARILVARRLSFAMAACRLEICLLLNACRLIDFRIAELEIFGLVDSALLLRRLFPVESAVWGA